MNQAGDSRNRDLTRVGRYKLNTRLGIEIPGDLRTLSTPIFTGSLMFNDITGWGDSGPARLPKNVTGEQDDLVELIRKLIDIPEALGVPHEDSEGNPTKEKYATE